MRGEAIVVQRVVGQSLAGRAELSGFDRCFQPALVMLLEEAAASARMSTTDSVGVSRRLGYNNRRN